MTAGEAQQAMRALPLAGLEAILGGTDPLVLAPHADDESLGCGGLLAACAQAGRRAAVLVLTDGAGSHPNSAAYPPERLRAVREAEAREAVRLLGLPADRIAFLGLRDTAAPTHGPDFEAAVDAVIGALRGFGTATLLSPWRHDPHCDHLAAHLIAAEAAGRAGAAHLAYPVWGWTLAPDTKLDGPLPEGWRLDIAAFGPVKQRAVQAHRSQYGALITDDPAGFRLPGSLLRHFETPTETFLSNP